MIFFPVQYELWQNQSQPQLTNHPQKGISKLFVFPDYWGCINQVPIIIERLNILGFGVVGVL
jgi:hypothetical protein